MPTVSLNSERDEPVPQTEPEAGLVRAVRRFVRACGAGSEQDDNHHRPGEEPDGARDSGFVSMQGCHELTSSLSVPRPESARIRM